MLAWAGFDHDELVQALMTALQKHQVETAWQDVQLVAQSEVSSLESGRVPRRSWASLLDQAMGRPPERA